MFKIVFLKWPAFFLVDFITQNVPILMHHPHQEESSIIHSSWEVENTWMTIDGWMNEEDA